MAALTHSVHNRLPRNAQSLYCPAEKPPRGRFQQFPENSTNRPLPGCRPPCTRVPHLHPKRPFTGCSGVRRLARPERRPREGTGPVIAGRWPGLVSRLKHRLLLSPPRQVSCSEGLQKLFEPRALSFRLHKTPGVAAAPKPFSKVSPPHGLVGRRLKACKSERQTEGRPGIPDALTHRACYSHSNVRRG